MLRGRTNFVKSLFALNRIYRPELLFADHAAPVAYEIPLPPRRAGKEPPAPRSLYVHPPRGRKTRAIDERTEQFVEATRIGASG